MGNPKPYVPPRIDARKRGLIARAYADGHRIKHIAESFGVSQPFVSMIAKEFGIAREPRRNAVYVTHANQLRGRRSRCSCCGASDHARLECPFLKL